MDTNYEMEHEELNVKEKNRPSEADLQQAGECGARSKNASHRPRRQLVVGDVRDVTKSAVRIEDY